MTRRNRTEPAVAVWLPASLARIIASGDAGSRDLDALERYLELSLETTDVSVRITRADAERLPDALAAAAERELSDVDDWSSDGEHPEEADHHRECVDALDRLSDAIADAVRHYDSEKGGTE